jgi:hypothetical protein
MTSRDFRGMSNGILKGSPTICDIVILLGFPAQRKTPKHMDASERNQNNETANLI